MSYATERPVSPQEEATRAAALVLVTDFPGALSIVITVSHAMVDGKPGYGMSMSARMGEDIPEPSEARLWEFMQAVNEAVRIATSKHLAQGGYELVRRDNSKAPDSLVPKTKA